MPASSSDHAYKLAEAGKLEESAEAYAQHLETASPEHWGTPLVLGEYGCVLTRLGRLEDAGQAYQRALELELEQANGEHIAGVSVARCFLAENLLSRAKPHDAIAVLEAPPQATRPPAQEAAVLTVKAAALFQLGEHHAAKHCAERAIALASGLPLENSVRERLSAILSGSVPT